MGEVIRVTDPGDPRLGDYACLSDPQLRKRYEHDVGVFIAEGPNVVRELVASDYRTKSLLLMPHRLDDLAGEIAAVDGPVFVADRELVREVVRFPNHQGALGCGHRRPLATPDEVLAGAGTVVVLEETNDPANLGAIFRSARALHVDAVLLGPRCADPLYRRTVRTSMGHVLHVPYAPLGDVDAGLADLRARGFRILALTPDPDAADLGALPPLDRVALLLGAEGPGLSEGALAGADLAVRIPMAASVDSLNVAVTAGIAFDALRRARDRTPAVPPSPSRPR
ncbi:MAG: RNA methyltransferase [Actinobacteria bacterium]|nr:RNA methyltransferase [Actinomycetota bacterium]